MTRNKQVQAIEDYIVRAHRAGACGPNGEHVPNEQKGRNGKGSHFRPARTEQYRENYAEVFGHD